MDVQCVFREHVHITQRVPQRFPEVTSFRRRGIDDNMIADRRALRARAGNISCQSVKLCCLDLTVEWLFLLTHFTICLLYTSDAADDLLCVDLGGRRIIKK